MVYEKDKIRRLIEYKEEITNTQIKNDIEWIVECYNEYYVNSNDYEYQSKQYKKILNKYYNVEDENANLKEQLKLLKHKYKLLQGSCENLKSMI